MATGNCGHLQLVLLLVTELWVGNFKEKYINTKLRGSQEVVTLLVLCPSCAKGTGHTQLSFRATFLLRCLLKSLQWLFGFSPLSFYEEIWRASSRVFWVILNGCLFRGLSGQMSWQSVAFQTAFFVAGSIIERRNM